MLDKYNFFTPKFNTDMASYHEKFYDQNILSFIEYSASADMTPIYYIVFDRIRGDISVLDVGCGFGRDLFFFTYNLGVSAEGFDISGKNVEFCQKIGLNVRKNSFENYETHKKFDVIWCNASFIHAYPYQIKDLFRKYEKMLKPGGYLFCNFMQPDSSSSGDDFGEFDERFFLYIGLNTAKYIALCSESLSLVEYFLTPGQNKKARTDAAYKTNQQYRLACDLNPNLQTWWNNYIFRKKTD